MSNIWAPAPSTNGQTSLISNTDLRKGMHTVIFGSTEFIGQGRYVILRQLTDTTCPACWSPNDGNSKDADCIYCDGEGYQFTERMLKMAIYTGVAPVYKAGVFGTGQYPVVAYGYDDVVKATLYCEWNVFPNYERYTLPSFSSPDKVFEVKVDSSGNPVYNTTTRQPIRIAKWKLLSVTPMFGDYGRIEYFELSTEKETIS